MQDFNHILRCQRPEAKTVNVFRDPSPVHKRPISNISWCPDGGSRIAISYCNLEFLGLQPETPRTSYIFNIGGKLLQ